MIDFFVTESLSVNNSSFGNKIWYVSQCQFDCSWEKTVAVTHVRTQLASAPLSGGRSSRL